MQNFPLPYKQTSVTVVMGQQQCLNVLQYRPQATEMTDTLESRRCLCNYCHCLKKETDVLHRSFKDVRLRNTSVLREQSSNS